MTSSIKSKRRVNLFLVGMLVITQARGATVQSNFSEHTPVNAAIRSMLVPGWGQWFNSQHQKGVLFGATTLVAAGASAWLFIQSKSTYDHYVARGVSDDPLYDQYQKERSGALIAVGAASVIYLYGIFDAYRTQASRNYAGEETGPVFAMDESGRAWLSYKVNF